jgi:hypothetical protein
VPTTSHRARSSRQEIASYRGHEGSINAPELPKNAAIRQIVALLRRMITQVIESLELLAKDKRVPVLQSGSQQPYRLPRTRNVKPMLKLGAALLIILTATGCVYIDGERVDTDDWRDTQRDNREAISKLEIGMSRTAVQERLGAPAESEAFTLDNEEVRVLFYRTQRRHSDGETTRDETTPLVFRNDRLTGWGNGVYDALR